MDIDDCGTQSHYVFGPGVGVARGRRCARGVRRCPGRCLPGCVGIRRVRPNAGAVVAFVVISAFYGIAMARRMSQFWPAATDLSGGDRVALARAARRGQDVDDARLATAAIEYGGGLRAAREQGCRWQWVVWLGAAAALVLAVFDTISGPSRIAAVSWLFVVFFVVEIFWWPRVQDRLLVNAERTGESARRALGQQQSDHA
jgi:hypothetical protein